MKTSMNKLVIGLQILAAHDPRAQPQISHIPVDDRGVVVYGDAPVADTLLAITVTTSPLPESQDGFLQQTCRWDRTLMDEDGESVRYEFFM